MTVRARRRGSSPTGPDYPGPWRHFVTGYLIAITLPFAAYFLLAVNDETIRFLRPWFIKSGIVFTVISSAEVAQYLGKPIFGETYDLGTLQPMPYAPCSQAQRTESCSRASSASGPRRIRALADPARTVDCWLVGIVEIAPSFELTLTRETSGPGRRCGSRVEQQDRSSRL